jgi:hypothetical protein
MQHVSVSKKLHARQLMFTPPNAALILQGVTERLSKQQAEIQSSRRVEQIDAELLIKFHAFRMSDNGIPWAIPIVNRDDFSLHVVSQDMIGAAKVGTDFHYYLGLLRLFGQPGQLVRSSLQEWRVLFRYCA